MTTPQHNNNSGRLTQKSDAELVAILRQWMGFREGQEDPRNFIISDVINDLRGRHRAPNEVSAMVGAINEDFHRLSNHISRLAAMQAKGYLNDQQAYPHRHIGYDGRQHGPQREFRGPPSPPGPPPPQSRRPIWPSEVNGLPPNPPANNAPNLGVGTHLNPLNHHNNGGLPDYSAERLNRWMHGDVPRLSADARSFRTPQNPNIMGDDPRVSANSGGVQAPNIAANRNVQANTIDLTGSTSSSDSREGGARRPLKTRYCGVYVPVPSVPTTRWSNKEDERDKSMWSFHCVICNGVFKGRKAVYHHFPGCVKRQGNPNSAHWYDHPSIDVSKIPDSLREKVRGKI